MPRSYREIHNQSDVAMRLLLAYLATITCLFGATFPALAAPKADLWRYWDRSNPQNTTAVDHHNWQVILDNNLVVSGDNTLFRYAQVSDADRKRLDRYLVKLAQLDPRQLNRQEQFAYWVNLYNALTVQLILDNYPLNSITQLGGLFSFGPWDQDIIAINQINLSLNDIEHRILRPIWQDKRIHYAVNCASLGCPNLMTQAFTSSNTPQLLAQAEAAFLRSDKGVAINGEQLQLSSIFDWYASDFGGKKALLNYLERFRPEITQTNKKPSYQYNWALNEAK